jgi:hypothetical protein
MRAWLVLSRVVSLSKAIASIGSSGIDAGLCCAAMD